MTRHGVLALVGYEPLVVAQLPEALRSRLVAVAYAWALVCVFLGLGGGYAAWLMKPSLVMSLGGGASIFLLSLNLLRVAMSGGGVRLYPNWAQTEAACDRYLPALSLVVVMGGLAVILSQPAQLPFWPELERPVEAHRESLMEQHDAAAAALGTDPAVYRAELKEHQFPIFRLKLMWQAPGRVLGWTVILCALVLFPAFYSRYFAIESIRAYERIRCRRKYELVTRLNADSRRTVFAALSQWPSFAAEHKQGGMG